MARGALISRMVSEMCFFGTWWVDGAKCLVAGTVSGCILSDRQGVQVDGEGDGFFIGKGEKNFVKKSSCCLV